MKKLLLVILLTRSPLLQAQTPPFADIEIVESIPVGTSLDNSDIRNTHDVWLEMIGRAQWTLDIEQFYISNEPGKLLEDVLAAIYKGADRGVKVRIIVNATEVFMGSQNLDWRGLELIHELGLRIHESKIASGFSDICELDWQIASMAPEQTPGYCCSPSLSFIPSFSTLDAHRCFHREDSICPHHHPAC